MPASDVRGGGARERGAKRQRVRRALSATSPSAAPPNATPSGGAPGGAGESRPHAQIAEIQRLRLLVAAVRTVEELGYTRTTVAHITHRARVSRRTFYELFTNREECLAAVLEDLLIRIQREIAVLGLGELPWRERVRAGLSVILCFLDREPELARVCVVQALRGGTGVLERREQILGCLAAVVDEGRGEHARGTQLTPLTAEGLVGAAFAIVYARLLRRERESLIALQSELMGMIVLPYLGPAAARREQTSPVAVAPRGATDATDDGRGFATRVIGDPLDGVPMRLTYRTTRVLHAVAEHPGASNRLVADQAGISDQGQVSKLLARLQRLELLANAGEGHLKGEPNAWTLTRRGQQVAQSIRMHTPGERRAA
jgi:AcrR family transcriptional regulator